MAGPGVVGMAEVVQPSSGQANRPLSGSPFLWSMIWVGAAALFLLFVHMSLAGRR